MIKINKKRILTFVLGSFIVILGAVHLMAYSMTMNDNKIIKTFSKKGISVTVDHLDIMNRKVRVVATEAKAEDSTLIVFVHGAPGSWDAFKKYMLDSAFLSRGRLVAYDRPGYGESGKESMTGISDQADVLKQIIEKYKLPTVVVIGHSYGCPIVGNIAARYPELIDKAVMIAPLNDPDNEPIFWVSYFAKWKTTKWLLPKDMQNAGDEKFSHAEELEKMKHLWAQLKVPTLHIHGSKDMLAPSDPNIAWSKNKLPQDILRLEVCEGEGHLVLWQAFYRTSGLILDFIK